jgi:exopolysaccharide biosynthesis polyprenyl glycosylphosphotransferase
MSLARVEAAVISDAIYAVALAAFGVAASYYHDLCDLRRIRSFGRSALRLPRVLAAALLLLLLLAVHALSAGGRITHPGLPSSVFAAMALPLVMGAAARRPIQRVLVIGSGPLVRDLTAAIEARPHLRLKVVGLVGDGSGGALTGPLRQAELKDLAGIVDEVRPDRVVVVLGSRRGRMPVKALLQLRLRGITVEDGIEVYERLTGKIPIEALTPASLIFCKQYQTSRLDLALAHALTLPAIAAALVLLAPVFGLIALAIKLDSPGPVFFAQERVGLGGRIFRLVKFRTMRPAPRPTSEWVRDNDGRLTRVGRWLRRFRLDELPQLWNILKGDMNLVGPRPHPVTNVPLFVMVMRNAPDCGEQIPYYAVRSMVRPGLTGWAQVRYRYANDLEEEIEKARYDLYYIKHLSPWLDLRILLETVKIVLWGREARAGREKAAPAKQTPATAAPAVAAAHVATAQVVTAPRPLAAALVVPATIPRSLWRAEGRSRRTEPFGDKP